MCGKNTWPSETNKSNDSNPAKLDGFELEPLCTQDEDFPGEVTCLMRVSHVLDMMFEEDYNIVSFGMFPEAFHMQPEEVCQSCGFFSA